MPAFDGTGPRGQGPLTGRGLGNCVVPGMSSSPFWGTLPGLPRLGIGRGLSRGPRSGAGYGGRRGVFGPRLGGREWPSLR